MSQWKHRIEMAVLLIFVMVSVAAQVRGVVTDSVSRERLPYVSISYNNKGVGHTDNNGDFYVRISDGCQTLTFSSVGYKSKTVTLEPVDGKKTLNVQLIPDNVMLKEMVVRPRRERYRKKDNPAIVMMRKVLAAKQRNRLEDNDYYRYHKYEKLNIALDDINPTSLNKGVLKKMPFLLDQLEVNAEDNALVLPVSVKETSSEVLRLCDGMQFHLALEKIFAFVRAINKYAEQRAPWKLAKSSEPSDREKLETTLSNMAEALRIASVLLAPVMPTVSEKILSLLGQPKAERYEGNVEWSNRLENSTLAAPEILFPRIGE